MIVNKWTPEQDEKLRALFDAGKSMAKIASELGGGLSRNAVVGRLHRIGLKSGHAVRNTPSNEKTPRKPRAQVAKVTVAEVAAAKGDTPPASTGLFVQPAPILRGSPRWSIPPAGTVPTPTGWPKPKTPTAIDLFGLTHKTCRMPLFKGHEPFDQQFYCGAEPMTGSPYCPSCRAITVQPRAVLTTKQPTRAA